MINVQCSVFRKHSGRDRYREGAGRRGTVTPRRTVIDGVLEEHEAHAHFARAVVVLGELLVHVRLNLLAARQVLVHVVRVQEVACKHKQHEY